MSALIYPKHSMCRKETWKISERRGRAASPPFLLQAIPSSITSKEALQITKAVCPAAVTAAITQVLQRSKSFPDNVETVSWGKIKGSQGDA
jgi:hypothetical protein